MLDKRTLLIMACSMTKLPEPGPLAAYERYDGPAYRVLRKSGWPAAGGPRVGVRILSAEYGLIGAVDPIEDYDRKMDKARALELGQLPLEQLQHATLTWWGAPATRVLVWGGALYRGVVQTWEQRGLFDRTPGGITYSSGGIGTQLGQLKRWLEECREERGWPLALDTSSPVG